MQTVTSRICLTAILNCPLAPPGRFVAGADVLTPHLSGSVRLAWDHGLEAVKAERGGGSA